MADQTFGAGPLSPACATFLQNVLPLRNSITRQLIELESRPNPLRIREVF